MQGIVVVMAALFVLHFWVGLAAPRRSAWWVVPVVLTLVFGAFWYLDHERASEMLLTPFYFTMMPFLLVILIGGGITAMAVGWAFGQLLREGRLHISLKILIAIACGASAYLAVRLIQDVAQDTRSPSQVS